MTTVGGDMIWGDPCNINEFRETGSIFFWHIIKDHLWTQCSYLRLGFQLAKAPVDPLVQSLVHQSAQTLVHPVVTSRFKR
jgi:hypothetical protein